MRPAAVFAALLIFISAALSEDRGVITHQEIDFKGRINLVSQSQTVTLVRRVLKTIAVGIAEPVVLTLQTLNRRTITVAWP